MDSGNIFSKLLSIILTSSNVHFRIERKCQGLYFLRPCLGFYFGVQNEPNGGSKMNFP